MFPSALNFCEHAQSFLRELKNPSLPFNSPHIVESLIIDLNPIVQLKKKKVKNLIHIDPQLIGMME
ncbi:hypothetical protein ACFLRT_03195 [Acidobacteriota bacterium]